MSTADFPFSDWFVTRAHADAAPARIYCFPHAGGSTRTFAQWQDALSQDAQILAVCRPGREHRAKEPSPSFAEFADASAEAILRAGEHDGRPVYLFGHSLGALVAFEVARRLAPRLPALCHLIASGCSAPSLLPSERVRRIAGLEGEDFARGIAFFGGLPAEVLDDADLRELLLPAVIGDFRMAVGYRYRDVGPLPVPITLINGREDPHVGPEQLEPWDREAPRPPERHWAEGGHFYFEQRPEAATDLLRAVVQADQHVELI